MIYLNQPILQLNEAYKEILGKGSGWVIDSVIDHDINISQWNFLTGRNYIKLTKELDHQRKGLINIQKIDDIVCFKWSFVRYLHLANHHPARMTKSTKILSTRLVLKT